MSNEDLIKLAIKASENSYSPYSKFRVGAALLAKSGKVYLGTNIENVSYPAGICAERTAFVKAISEGEKEFEKIAIVGGKDGNFKNFCTPCGICRQFISEFCNKDFKFILGNDKLEYNEYTLTDLLPFNFEG